MTNDATYSGVKLGFIGVGNMGGALARAARKSVPGACIGLAGRTPEKIKILAEELGCRASGGVGVAKWADYVFLGVKPQMMPQLLTELKPELAERPDRFVLVTMAAGLSIARVQELAGGTYPVIRIMPNTPVAVGRGMILYTCGESVTGEEERIFLEAMAGAGRFSRLPERLMDAGSAVSGCGPAFADLFLEAMADGGVACGLPRAQAVELAAQMMLGSAKLALRSGQHPGALKDAVCSPGGATIQGVRALEAAGFRGAVMEAVIASYEKTLELK
ncbi:pyrroline-5-carboxylate reductase [Oscillibacter sp.]|jgi:pyrroline-5-carboxylate reductase|uniref:pyrroline-5-carboxylate reductase n=1 Tax=Oscillibacter sp. TaxID=1945593 RepID=UPI00216EA6D2|nr:pyrroline-5-carboxylate reductase [Oscillibacter sp.]MCI9649900.1 pyrroline-5-carboxylate reductase [Oscillibacter sp.]